VDRANGPPEFSFRKAADVSMGLPIGRVSLHIGPFANLRGLSYAPLHCRAASPPTGCGYSVIVFVRSIPILRRPADCQILLR
jgi:hypothetical protein